MNWFKKKTKSVIRMFGYNLTKQAKNIQVNNYPIDFEELHKSIIESVKEYTMTSNERIYTLIEALKYISNNNIEGDIVECGVWKGGSMMAVANTLLSLNDVNRKLYLYDTYDGMSEPTEIDIDCAGNEAKDMLNSQVKSETDFIWAYSPIEKVKSNILKTGYPSDLIHCVKGKVEDTLLNNSIDKISLLRLDTDWYESTKIELELLFPKLQKGGILIIDDYGHWEGSKKAVDEYLDKHKLKLFLSRIDYTGRVAVKL